MNWQETSGTTKAVVYLGGLIVAAFIGGMVASKSVSEIANLPDTVQKLQEDLAELRAELANLEGRYVLESNIPDFGTFAMKTDLNDFMPNGDYLKVGDEVKLRYASNDSKMYLSSLDFNAITGPKFGLWALER